jgi:NADP-dependent 3-hydroxy acid dehydrogenase YdfG
MCAMTPSGQQRRSGTAAQDLWEPSTRKPTHRAVGSRTEFRMLTVRSTSSGVDTLANNAGIYVGKPFHGVDPRRLRRGHCREPDRVHHITQLAIPQMVNRGTDQGVYQGVSRARRNGQSAKLSL